MSELRRLVKVAALSAGVTLFTVNDLGLIAKVEGNSMQPSFNPKCGQKNLDLARLLREPKITLKREELAKELKTRIQQDRVLLNKWVVRDKYKLQVGDVVILVSPRDPSKSLIKRITAMPGDSIYLVEKGETKIITPGHCWVEGDNQLSSYDSNSFGEVPLGLVEGRVCFILWPLSRIGPVRNDPLMASNSTKTVLLS